MAFEKGTRTSFSACGIPYLVSGEVEPFDALVARTPREFREANRIDVRIQHEVLAIDTDRRQVEVRDHGHGRTFRIGFDHLVIGTGARPTRPDLPGIDGDGVLGVQNLDDAAVLLAQAEQSRCQEVVVVGGGYIGLEMAEAFVMWGANVTLVDASPAPHAHARPRHGRARPGRRSSATRSRCAPAWPSPASSRGRCTPPTVPSRPTSSCWAWA